LMRSLCVEALAGQTRRVETNALMISLATDRWNA
jgi:hypothetical protein